MRPGDDLDQRRLARAVLADQARAASPARSSNETPLRAWTPPNALVISVSLSSVVTGESLRLSPGRVAQDVALVSS